MLEFLSVQLKTQLEQRFGQLIRADQLSGLTDADVWRVHFVAQSVIVKRTTNSNEAFFYEQVAPVFCIEGVPSPELLHLEKESVSDWLVLEDIPLPFPRARWLMDEEQLYTLRRLHQVDGAAWRTAPTLFKPAWTSEMTDAALTWFPEATGWRLYQQLEQWRNEAKPLFEPRCLISGDPNPLNWGLRLDGTLVHFDWERFGWGTPAIDLAITVPGLGSEGDYYALSTAYLQSSDELEVEVLSSQIRIAKVWTVVELLAKFHLDGNAADAKRATITSYLVEELPKWCNIQRQPIE